MVVRKFLQVGKEKDAGKWQMPVKTNIILEFLL